MTKTKGISLVLTILCIVPVCIISKDINYIFLYDKKISEVEYGLIFTFIF